MPTAPAAPAKRPQARPEVTVTPASPEIAPATADPQTTPEVASSTATAPSIRPHPRPEGLGTVTASASASQAPARVQATAKAPASKRELRRKGAVCGDVEIIGEPVGKVSSPNGSCGIEDAVRIRSVAGISLSQPALMNCPTAAALKTWVVRGVQPSFRKRDQVVQLQVAAHYACRSRNNVKGARLSEHSKGNAVDISGFVLKSGKTLSVLKDYSNSGPLGAARRAACGIFGTVLGPGSDRYHANHFHLDTARYRTGAYCR
ncbi:extensin-like domain-containing protein [Seohaeicola zhoushanensis]|uniref:extensin-like domain-containing protein n=1 Tax=Seohaeicola zhoushanensis TaxID=1569283 RepID=UPI001E3F4052|nr:extensin family protein [Seohaeicola zhoushanensis]